MDGKKDQPEPTMEEILASIRRIISEDAEEGQPEAKAGEVDTTAGEPAEPSPKEREQGAGDDIFELTQVAEEPEAEGIDIPETVPDDRAGPEPDPVPPAAEPPTGEGPAEAPAPEPEPEAPKPAPALSGAEEPGPDDEALMSTGPAAATTAAFAGLMGALDRSSGAAADMPIGNSGLTLEELVRQMLRPMMREWLDANLPGLVERLVKREIERMVRRAED